MKILDVTKAHTKEILVQTINKAIDANQWSNKEVAYILGQLSQTFLASEI